MCGLVNDSRGSIQGHLYSRPLGATIMGPHCQLSTISMGQATLGVLGQDVHIRVQVRGATSLRVASPPPSVNSVYFQFPISFLGPGTGHLSLQKRLQGEIKALSRISWLPQISKQSAIFQSTIHRVCCRGDSTPSAAFSIENSQTTTKQLAFIVLQ